MTDKERKAKYRCTAECACSECDQQRRPALPTGLLRIKSIKWKAKVKA